MTLQITPAVGAQQNLALRLLFSKFPLAEQESRLTETLSSAASGRLDLKGLLLAEENGQPVGVALTMQQPDGVTLVWPPIVTCQAMDSQSVEDALMVRLCGEIDAQASKLAQALLSPDDSHELALLERHGFDHLADMFFLARTLTPSDLEKSDNPGDFDHETYNEQNAHRFAAMIERTYLQSLDCPFLNGFRNGSDALVSHRLSGQFDPAGWRLYRVDSQDAGVLLMNEHPDQDAIELVYFGIAPEFRGRGWGRQLLADGIQAAAITRRAVLYLAVDCANTYANALYSELQFAELARRRIAVRRSSELARK